MGLNVQEDILRKSEQVRSEHGQQKREWNYGNYFSPNTFLSCVCVRVINFRRVNATLQCTNARAPACVCTSVPILHVLRVQKKAWMCPKMEFLKYKSKHENTAPNQIKITNNNKIQHNNPTCKIFKKNNIPGMAFSLSLSVKTHQKIINPAQSAEG